MQSMTPIILREWEVKAAGKGATVGIWGEQRVIHGGK